MFELTLMRGQRQNALRLCDIIDGLERPEV